MHQRLRLPTLLAFAAALLLALLFAPTPGALAAPPRPIPGEFLVKYRPAVTLKERQALRQSMRAEQVHAYRYIPVEHLRIPGLTPEQAQQRFAADPRIEYIEPNYEVSIDLVPNDVRFPELYGLRNTGQTGGTPGADIRAVNAWDLFTGDPNLKIGVIDTGVDYNHEDLAANAWTNPGEIPGNGLDDDGNGYVDDVHGYDFVNNDGDPMDDNGHGSHCAGTIAGVGNNSLGVVGVAWRASIVGIKFLSASGSGSTANAVRGVEYAITVGCRLTSNSWGGGGFSQALLDAINAAGAADQLFIAAAGNSSVNTDVSPHYPSSYNTPYVIAVAATDHNDNLASFSNYGATTVDLAAPGVNILSAQPGGGYRLLSGTSMATPHVAGAVALARGRFPSAGALQIKQLLLNAVDVKASLQGKVLTNGRLNAFMTIADPDETPPGQITDLVTTSPSSNAIGLAWTATGDDGTTGRASSYEIRYSTAPITDLASFLAATLVNGTPDPQPFGSPESFEVTGLDFNTTYFFALRAKDEFGNPGPVSNVATGTTLGVPNLAGAPASFSSALLTGGVDVQVLTLSNTGEGTLDFTVPTPQLQFSQPAPFEPTVIGKGADDWRIGDPVTDGAGGPDAFGYRWVDSHEPGGPAFAWVDITGVGTQATLTGDDAWSAPIAMGMDFPFYGGTFNSVRVQTNGFLSFTESSGDYFDNQPLPTSGAPANLVAPFWDDQDFGATRRVWTHFDGTRFIVSWVGVPRYQTGGPYTYQAILYPTGEIVFQYLTMGAPTNGATVGIQNATKTTGLTVAFNTNYVQDNLAVRIVPLRQWLRVTPAAGRIHAGQSQQLQVTFDATGLDGGPYDGTVRVLSNDPDGSPAEFPAHLQVTGAPDLAFSPASLDFGQVFVGAHPTRTLTVSNPGTDVLNVTVTSGDPTVTVDTPAFSLNPKAARNLTVTFSPTAPAVVTTALTLASNDPDAPSVNVPVTGEGVPAPAFAVTPNEFNETLLTNTAVSRTLRISNSGGSNFVFTAEALALTPTGTVVVHGDADNVDVPKGGEDVQFGPAPARAGGPDVFGYTYQDSDEPGGPTFSWVDVRTVGTQIPMTGDDANTGPFPIGFNFPFYGKTFSSFRISTNGFVSFTSNRTTFTNTTLPNNGTSVPENLLAVFWDDLHFETTPKAWYHYDGTKLVIQFQGVRRIGESSTTNPNTFEILLYPNGTIVYQYLDMRASNKASATIGIQNEQRNDGLQVVFNAAYVKNNLAIRFQPPARFLTVSPAAGTVPPGGFVDLNVGFNASGLFGGLYQGQVRIRGNDPVLPEKNVPANLTVIGVPDVAVAPPAIDFGTAFLGFPQLRQITVSNTGTDALQVTGITFDDPAFGVDQSVFTVPPLGSAVLFVSFNPSLAQPYAATMTIASNDPDESTVQVALTGAGLVAPDVRPDPASIAATVNIPGTETRTLTVHNDGGSDLTFVVGTQITPTSVPVHAALELDKEQADPREGILGSGGPDAFGYTWRDSDDPGGPVFDWVDITGIGTPVAFTSGDDNNVAGIPLGFDFPFYGNTFNTVNVCTNGWLSFTNTTTDLSNDPLPNSAAPENLLAVFWDDLLPGTSPPRVYRYADGTRFIVSYVGVPRFSSGGPYTFQVILYPSGRIVYQYLSMQGTRLNEATIGLQNAARNDGLTIVHNANYVHDNLAIEIATIPDYLTVTPTTGTVPPGGSLALQVQFNTAGLFGGHYDGAVRIQSNDPDEPVVSVPTSLTAVGTPDVAASPASLDFGWLYLTQTRDLVLQVRNVGSDVLTISGLGITHPAFSLVGAPAFPVALGKNGALALTVRFAPTEACAPCAGNLVVASNDPDAPELAVPLTGIGVVPPEIETAPAELRAALATTLGPTAVRTTKLLVIENTGGSDLTWTAEALSALPAAISVASGENGKDETGTPGALGAGGPDAFGYRWADSDDPNGPAFEWVDITGVGTEMPVNGDDQNVGPFPLPFPFTFYGNTFTEYRICSNGWISFTNTSTALSNTSLPNTTAPENLIAAFWDDLDLRPSSGGGKVYSHYDGSKFIVSYVNVPRYSSGGPYTFQILLYPSGTVDFQYLDMQGSRLNEATIGIQNAARDVGLTVVYNAAYVKNNHRVRFSNQPGWLTVTPAAGTTPAGERDTLVVAFDATGLADGDHEGSVRVRSNDLDEPLVVIPAHLHVGVATATFDLDPNTLNRSSNGRWVSGSVTPPDGFDPLDIVTSSVLVQRVVPVAAGAPIALEDGAMRYKFDRAAVQAAVPDGENVAVEVIGRVDDATWFRGEDVIRVLRPRVVSRSAAPDEVGGMPESVTSPSVVSLSLVDPVGHTAGSFDLWYSPDAGESWLLQAAGLTAREFSWSVPPGATPAGMLELVAYDAEGPMGSWLTNLFEVLGSTTGVDDRAAPERFAVRFAGRNPASRATLEFGLPARGDLSVRVYDVRGALVRELAGGVHEPGWQRVTWDGRDGDGHAAQPGVYFVQTRWNGERSNLRFVLLK
uniref:Choice-of-anchor D domain-containing protein n=1 Tax=Eiseniibacteriota bacterium TaxID=2212470 RepID=A0A832I5Z7_UNCEI